VEALTRKENEKIKKKKKKKKSKLCLVREQHGAQKAI
jgi:hypothetical protein